SDPADRRRSCRHQVPAVSRGRGAQRAARHHLHTSSEEESRIMNAPDKHTAAPRIGVDVYLEWLQREGLPVTEDFGVDLLAVPTRPWARYGVNGAAVHLKGRGDFLNMFVFEIPASAATTPQRHLYEEVFYVLDGRGSTTIETADGRKHSFEWGPRSLFAIPLNTRYRL